jgi:hypothetical protein
VKIRYYEGIIYEGNTLAYVDAYGFHVGYYPFDDTEEAREFVGHGRKNDKSSIFKVSVWPHREEE